MKRLVAMVVAAGAAMAAAAMPTKAELQKAQEMVTDVTAADVAALKAKTKKPAEVAAKHMELAGQAGSEAEKYLLLQGAFKLYAKAGDYDAAANVIEKLQTEITDYDPEVTVELCGAEFIRKMRENAPRLYALKENARRIVFYRKQLPIREAAVKKNPKDAQAQRKLAECHAELGDWPKALEVFVKAGGELKKMSEGETSGKVPAQELGDFWWDYETKSDTQVYKLHAAELYRTALADNSFKGLARTRAEQRVKEVAGNAAAVAADGQGASPRTPAATGLYCVIDLSGGPDAKKYPVSYLNDIPKGGWSDEYKTTKLVLRRIEPGAFMMGERGNMMGEHGKNKRVEIDKPFYLGVFEVTQKQWELVMGDRPSFWMGSQWPLRPVEQVTYDMIRGENLGRKWPESDEVDECSFMGLLRKKTGLRFDLPREAQWEYACRAGTVTPFHNNCEMVNGEKDPSLDKIARYRGTGGWNEGKWGKFDWGTARSVSDRNCGANNGTAVVGSYQPNNWGLYDMLGNVYECCLDYEKATRDDIRVIRGGHWLEDAWATTAYHRVGRGLGFVDFGTGLRLCLPLADGAVAQSAATATVAVEKDLYCVIDLSAGPDAKKYRVSYLNGVPKGGWIDEYKTTKLVLRRVEPGTFMMGKTGESRRVEIAKAFYIGVFEVTQKQWELVMGNRPSAFGGSSWRLRPVDNVSYDMIRGKVKGAKWPVSDDVDADSFIGLVRAKTGIRIDLSTKSQWEYACRAGTTTDFYNGKSCLNDEKDSSLDGIARYSHNGGWDESKWGSNDNKTRWAKFFDRLDLNGDKGTATVGSYAPNNWGLYDMIGNVREWCLDKSEDKGKAYSEGLGGCWVDGAGACTVFSASRLGTWRNRHDFGFRVSFVMPDGKMVK